MVEAPQQYLPVPVEQDTYIALVVLMHRISGAEFELQFSLNIFSKKNKRSSSRVSGTQQNERLIPWVHLIRVDPILSILTLHT